MLSTTTAAIGAMLTASPALAALEALSSDKGLPCASLHPRLGNELALLCDDPGVSSEMKNIALKTASCPHCAVRIAPFGGSVGNVLLG